jgi:hypothetical protein
MSIPRREDLPEDFYALRNVTVSFPRLDPDLAETSPTSLSEILEYLGWEAPGGENAGGDRIIQFQLEFIRTALVEKTKYWIWRFFDERGTECYVTVALTPRNDTITGYDESFGFTPEQFILADYYELS